MYKAECVIDKITKGGKNRVVVRGNGVSGSIYFNKEAAPGNVSITFHAPETKEHDTFLKKLEMERGY